MPGQPVLIAVLSSMKVLVGHKTVLMTELWPKKTWTLTQSLEYSQIKPFVPEKKNFAVLIYSCNEIMKCMRTYEDWTRNEMKHFLST